MRGLYLITPDWDDTEKLLHATEQALLGGAILLQYRHKLASPALRQEQATALLALCRRLNKPLIINDFIDLCIALDADGVHVGGTDAPVAEARAALGPAKIVGASCYGSLGLAQTAVDGGASYVAFGGFYPSRVKKYPVTTALDIVQLAKARFSLPCCVLGGMTLENSSPLVARGADMVAVISSIYQADDPQTAAHGFANLYDSLVV
jgi:thiamine-phosphate pyrophosphorylase